MAEHEKDTKTASLTIAILSTIGLTVSFYIATVEHTNVPIFLYAIFGGGILGTDNIIKVIKSIFRVNDDE